MLERVKLNMLRSGHEPVPDHTRVALGANAAWLVSTFAPPPSPTRVEKFKNEPEKLFGIN